MAFDGRIEDTPLLDVIQIIAYSQQTGVLAMKGSGSKGLVLFSGGNIVAAFSPSALSLLVKAAKETDSEARLALRRIQALAALREMFGLTEGAYNFVKQAEPVRELEGLDIGTFYTEGALDTGDLLLVLAKAMDESPPEFPTVDTQPVEALEQREHTRYGPIIINATLQLDDDHLEGFITNLSLGGAFFHGDYLPPNGSYGQLLFQLPWNLGPCAAEVSVVWVREHGPDTRRGAGLSFQEVTPEGLEKLTEYLEQFQQFATDMDFQA